MQQQITIASNISTQMPNPLELIREHLLAYLTVQVALSATRCIGNFIVDMIDTRRTIIGYHGTKTSNLKMGTIRWKWTYNQGLSHIHTIPNSFYSPEGQCRLLSPQTLGPSMKTESSEHYNQERSNSRMG